LHLLAASSQRARLLLHIKTTPLQLHGLLKLHRIVRVLVLLPLFLLSAFLVPTISTFALSLLELDDIAAARFTSPAFCVILPTTIKNSQLLPATTSHTETVQLSADSAPVSVDFSQSLLLDASLLSLLPPSSSDRLYLERPLQRIRQTESQLFDFLFHQAHINNT
jgi:hypothetical protein